MSRLWVAQLTPRALSAVRRLRGVAGVELAESKNVWLRGPLVEGKLPNELAAVPTIHVYELLDEVLLAPLGSSVPTAKMPGNLKWTGLDEIFQGEVSKRSYPASGETLTLPQLSFERSEHPAEPQLLRLPFYQLSKWVVQAPEIRLRSLQFACSNEREALVIGSPLPPLPGKHYVLESGIAVLAGWTWDPPLPARALAGALKLRPGDLALLEPQRDILVIPANSLVPLTRAAVRLSPTTPGLPESEEDEEVPE